MFTCFGNTPFESVDEMAQRIDEVLAVVAAFPESIMSKRVDHSQDDLVEPRISKLDNVDDAWRSCSRSRRRTANSSQLPTRRSQLSPT